MTLSDWAQLAAMLVMAIVAALPGTLALRSQKRKTLSEARKNEADTADTYATASGKVATQNIGLQDRMGELDAKYSGLEKQYREIKTLYLKLQDDYGVLGANYAEAQLNISRAADTYATAIGKVTAQNIELHDRQDLLEGKYDRSQKQYAELRAVYRQLKDDHDVLNAKYAEAQREISRRDSRISALEDQADIQETEIERLRKLGDGAGAK